MRRPVLPDRISPVSRHEPPILDILQIKPAGLLEPVRHFEEVMGYRVGQAVLHSTQ